MQVIAEIASDLAKVTYGSRMVIAGQVFPRRGFVEGIGNPMAYPCDRLMKKSAWMPF